MSRVQCYAGASYPERPTAFEQEGRWLEVIEVRRRVRTPQGLFFDVLASDQRLYRLTWREIADEWDVRPGA